MQTAPSRRSHVAQTLGTCVMTQFVVQGEGAGERGAGTPSQGLDRFRVDGGCRGRLLWGDGGRRLALSSHRGLLGLPLET